MKSLRILLDLDCVLADFVGGVCSLWGLSVGDVLAEWTPGEYGMNVPLGRAAGLGRALTDEEFWDPIGRTVGFWSNLPELPWAGELLSAVRSATDDWYVVTSPSRCPRCVPEKRAWLHRTLGVEWYDRMIPTPHKELMAVARDRTVVLIDDYERNCEAFAVAGGTPILFPAHHNTRHLWKTTPLTPVLTDLNRILGV